MASFYHMDWLNNFTLLGAVQFIHPIPHSSHQSWDTAILFASSPLQNTAKAALVTLPKPDFNPQAQQQGQVWPVFPSCPFQFILVLGVYMEHSTALSHSALEISQINATPNRSQWQGYRVFIAPVFSLWHMWVLPRSPKPPQGSPPWNPDAHQMRTLKILIGRCKLLNRIQ